MQLGRIAALAVLTCVSTPADALELYCAGRTWYGDKLGDYSTVLVYNESNEVGRIALPYGEAKGRLTVDEQKIKGVLNMPDGATLSVTIDRFDGSIWILPLPLGSDGRAVFYGECSKQNRRF